MRNELHRHLQGKDYGYTRCGLILKGYAALLHECDCIPCLISYKTKHVRTVNRIKAFVVYARENGMMQQAEAARIEARQYQEAVNRITERIRKVRGGAL